MAIGRMKDGRVFVYYYVPGADGKRRQRREYFGKGAMAEAAAAQRNNGLALKRTRPAETSIEPTVGSLAEAYWASKPFNANSLAQLQIRLGANILSAMGFKIAAHLTDHDIDRYIATRTAAGVKNSTIRRELVDLKAILNWATRRNPPMIRTNPIAHIRLPAEDLAVIAPPTPGEVQSILEHASPHLARAMMLSYYLGLRPGAVELLRLTWNDVLWAPGAIQVTSAAKGGPRSRIVPIHDSLMPFLERWHAEDLPRKIAHIVHYRKKPVKRIIKAWRGALARGGITRRLRPYDLRHHFVTAALEAGQDIKALAEIVGSRPETLMRHYQHVTAALHRKAVAAIPTMDASKFPTKIPWTKKKKRGKLIPLSRLRSSR